MKLNPLHDRVLIKPIAATVSPGGIVLPDGADGPLLTGRVIAVGPGTNRRDVFCRVSVKPGDIVRYWPHAMDQIEHEGERYDLTSDIDIRCTITES